MKNEMNWKIWGKKVLVTSISVVIAGGVSVWQDNPYWLALLPVAKGIENYLKHK